MSWADDNDHFEPGWWWEDSQWDCDLEYAVESAAEQGLWLDKEGKLYEMEDLTDRHIASILRMAKKMPNHFRPMVQCVRDEHNRRDRRRRNKFFGESMVI